VRAPQVASAWWSELGQDSTQIPTPAVLISTTKIGLRPILVVLMDPEELS
jgi:hypothetical protein